MKKWKSYYRRGISLLLVAAMLATGNVSEVSAAAASYQQKAKAQEASLRSGNRSPMEGILREDRLLSPADRSVKIP